IQRDAVIDHFLQNNCKIGIADWFRDASGLKFLSQPLTVYKLSPRRELPGNNIRNRYYGQLYRPEGLWIPNRAGYIHQLRHQGLPLQKARRIRDCNQDIYVAVTL